MALAPKFAGHKLSANSKPVHTIELYLDYVCPFSKKLFNTVYTSVFPDLVSARYADKVQFIFRQQIQPWHPSSTLVHEAALAVLKLAPDRFWEYSAALFEHQTEYFDVSVVNQTRNETYKKLAALAAGTVGLPHKQVLQMLWLDDKPKEDGSLNIGNWVTDDLKVLVKMNRLTGVHVTPTVIFNGVVETSISSSFTKEQWADWLQKNIV